LDHTHQVVIGTLWLKTSGSFVGAHVQAYWTARSKGAVGVTRLKFILFCWLCLAIAFCLRRLLPCWNHGGCANTGYKKSVAAGDQSRANSSTSFGFMAALNHVTPEAQLQAQDAARFGAGSYDDQATVALAVLVVSMVMMAALVVQVLCANMQRKRKCNHGSDDAGSGAGHTGRAGARRARHQQGRGASSSTPKGDDEDVTSTDSAPSSHTEERDDTTLTTVPSSSAVEGGAIASKVASAAGGEGDDDHSKYFLENEVLVSCAALTLALTAAGIVLQELEYAPAKARADEVSNSWSMHPLMHVPMR
jgi:hypothetical protein